MNSLVQCLMKDIYSINHMLENGPRCFEGGMTAKKYIAITKTSKATATPDFQHIRKLSAIKQIAANGSVGW